MNDLRDSAFALREAQRAYMADRGNEAKGKAVAAAAERLDAAIAAVDAGQAGRVHRMVAENDALRNAIGSRVDAALSAAQPEGGDAVAWAVINHCDNDKLGIALEKPGAEWFVRVGAAYTVRPLIYGDTRPAPAQQAWQPIETAPHGDVGPDEQRALILVRSDYDVRVEDARFVDRMRKAAADDGERCVFTHWMPIPALTSTAAKAAEGAK